MQLQPFYATLVCSAFVASVVNAAEFFEISRGGNLGISFYGLSGDGSTVIGSVGRDGFRWTRDAGLTYFGTLPDWDKGFSRAERIPLDLSHDGSIVAGRAHIGERQYRGFVWSEMSGLVDIGVQTESAWGVSLSADGSTLVLGQNNEGVFPVWTWDEGLVNYPFPATSPTQSIGQVEISEDGDAAVGTDSASFYWAPESGVQLLPLTARTPRTWRTIFNDGDGVVGVVGGSTLAKWTATEGLTELGFVSASLMPTATHVSDDGSVIAVRTGPGSGPYVPWIWTEEGGLEELELPHGVASLTPQAMTRDGERVFLSNSNFANDDTDAYIWDREGGLRPFADMLAEEFGVHQLADWQSTIPWAVSDDGKTIAGAGRTPLGRLAIWLVDLNPELPLLHGDYNNNGRVEQADLDLVLLNWNEPAANLPDTWVNERPTTGIIDQDELDRVLLGWGNAVANTAAGPTSVPEPASWLLLAATAVFWQITRPNVARLRRAVV